MSIDRRVWAVAASLALLSLGVLVRDQLPQAFDRAYAPFVYDETAPKLGTVEDVRTTVADSLNGASSNADWVVVDFGFTPDADKELLEGEVHGEDGTIFASVNSMLRACGVTYPELRTTCSLVFEMPAEKVSGATLHLGVPGGQMSPEVVVPLGEPERTGDVVKEEIDL